MNKNSLYNGIIIIIFVFVFGWVIISNYKLSKVSHEYEKLLREQTQCVDSLELENISKKENVLMLEGSLKLLEARLDSLNSESIKISRDTFVISNNLSKSVELLKINLQCVEL